ncbi:MAG: DUF2092 domain-containing protein [Pirellulales bacterium]
MRKVSPAFLVVVCACAAFSLLSCDQRTRQRSAAGRNEASAAPQPEELLKQMTEYLGDLPAFSCKVESEIHIQAKAMDNRMVTKWTVRMERPNRLAIIVNEGMMGMTYVSDGKQVVQYIPMMNRYAVSDAPADFSDLRHTTGAFAYATMALSGSMIPDRGQAFYDKLMDGATKAEYVGTDKIGGVLCHHCRLHRTDYKWDIWIEAGDKPLVRKMAPDLSMRLEDAGGRLEDAKMEYSVAFSEWDVAPKFTDADFAFTPPADARQVESLYERDEPPPHPLLGQPAPAFETVDLEDRPIDLSQHLGKGIVLLDFWATWCGPCVEAMPDVDAVAEKYADRGLVFYAVNVGEDAATAKEFLTESKLDVPVAMDPDGTISKLYQVDGIPQTVLIGKDGKVQVVHVGFSSELGTLLTQNIEDLLAGKDLASEALSESDKAPEKQDAGQGESNEADEPAGESASIETDSQPNGGASQVDESAEAETADE